LQRIAYHGAGTIAGALNETGLDNPNDLQELIRNSYAWEKSLQALLSDVDMVRAWKDPQYRQELSPIEKATMDPHPSGEGGLKGTPLDLVTAERRGLGVGGFSTWTIVAICCSTGALSCTQATEYKVCRTSDIECGILAIK
jgi:mersacidin/lichenicidin family type 2 lantibiotic